MTNPNDGGNRWAVSSFDHSSLIAMPLFEIVSSLAIQISVASVAALVSLIILVLL